MTLIGIFLTIILGFSIVLYISNKFNLLEYIGLAFPIGIGVQTFIMFILNFCKLNYSVSIIFALSIILSSAFFIAAFFRYKNKIFSLFLNINWKNFNFIWLAGLFLSCYVVYAISAKSLFWPTFASDSLNSFDLFAKALAEEKTLFNSLILEQRVGWGAAYPPLYSLALAYSYMIGFELSKIIPTLFFISLAITFYSFTKEVTNKTNAIVFTLLMILTPELLAQSAINITNVPQATYGALGIISLMLYVKLKKERYIYISSLLIAFNGFIRSEGIIYILIAISVVVLFQLKEKNYKSIISYSIIALLPFFLWQLFLKINTNLMEVFTQVHLSLIPNTEQISLVLDLGVKVIKSTQYYGVSFGAFLLFILLNTINIIRKKDNVILLCSIFILFFGYLFLLNQFELKSDSIQNIINYSGKRFFFGVIVLMWFYIASNKLIYDIFNKIEKWLNFNQR